MLLTSVVVFWFGCLSFEICYDSSLLVSAFQIRYAGGGGSASAAYSSLRTVDSSLLLLRLSSSEELPGLLRGIDPQCDDYFSSAMDVSPKGLAWLKNPGVFWQAVQKDAKLQNVRTADYMDTICLNLETYVNSGVLYGHDSVTAILHDDVKLKGRLALLIGGKREANLILTSLRDRFNHGDQSHEKRMVLYLDGSKYPDQSLPFALLVELVLLKWVTHFKRQLSEDQRSAVLNYINAVVKKSSRAAIAEAKKYVKQEVRATRWELSWLVYLAENARQYWNGPSPRQAFWNVCDDFIRFARQRGCYPVLTIDGAENVLGGNSGDYLAKLDSATAQYEMSVILATSEYDYPFQLESKGFYLGHWTSITVTGDLCPRETWDLLVNANKDAVTPAAPAHPKPVGLRQRLVAFGRRLFCQDVTARDFSEIVTFDKGASKAIGMGCELAELCLGAYGGNIVAINDAMKQIASRKEQFLAIDNFSHLEMNAANNCLKIKGARQLLEIMAKQGFMPVSHPSDALTRIVKERLGGLVALFRIHIEQLPDAVWHDRYERYCIIPPYNSVRLVIALELAVRPALAANIERNVTMDQ